MPNITSAGVWYEEGREPPGYVRPDAAPEPEPVPEPPAPAPAVPAPALAPAPVSEAAGG